MTVPARNARRVVTNDGSVDEIEVLFPAELAVYVKVYAGDQLEGAVTQLTYGVHYTLSGIGPNTTSFIVNITNPLAWDVDIYPRFAVFVDYPVDQQSDIGLGGTFGDRFEAALDRVVWMLQSLNDRQKRSLVMPLTRTLDENYTLDPIPGCVVGFDENGMPVAIDLISLADAQAAAATAVAAAAEAVAAVASIPATVLTVLSALPNRDDGDITGLITGQWYINGGYLARVQP